VTEKLFGKTFQVALGVSLVYAASLAVWYLYGISP
jgi:hypothetical protein